MGLFSFIGEQRDKDQYRIKKLEECVIEALNYRPLPTDPLQVFIRERCPDLLEKWEEEHK